MVATATTTVASVIFAVITIGWIVYYFANRKSAAPELGSETVTAPNRKPYYDDETLEGPRLERMQLIGLILLIITVIALPLYWVFEPDRQAGATEQRASTFAYWGSELFETTANGGFNCAGCHGGMNATGGNAEYAITDQLTQEVKAVSWYAPALNTVTYRFDDSEIKYILVYGRVGSPMAAWGVDGGGPMNDQQLNTLIAYIHSIQIPRVGCLDSEPDPRTCPTGELPEDVKADIQTAAEADATALVEAGKYDSVEDAMGEALFNLELNSGAYSCARCHTEGWSYGEPKVPGQGNYGWNLTGGVTNEHYPNEQDMIEQIKAGSKVGERFGGPNGQGTGRMPGFGNMLTDEQITQIVEYVRDL